MMVGEHISLVESAADPSLVITLAPPDTTGGVNARERERPVIRDPLLNHPPKIADRPSGEDVISQNVVPFEVGSGLPGP